MLERVKYLLHRSPMALHHIFSTTRALVFVMPPTQWFVEELVRFGAVHWCPVAPEPSASSERAEQLTAGELAAAQAVHDAGIARWGKSVSHMPRCNVAALRVCKLLAEQPGTDRKV